MQTLHTFYKLFKTNLLKTFPPNYNYLKNYTIKLQEVGHLEAPMEKGNYKTGQTFVHKQLAYRGIVLFPWSATVLDRDVAKKTKRFMNSDESSRKKRPEGESSQVFYNILIDSRDAPFVRSHTEVLTFFGNESGQSLVLIPGMDSVAHKNVLPYKPTEPLPLQHELLSKFFTYAPNKNPPFVAKTTLRVWEKKNRSWLELTKVHQETTEQVRVTVITFYLGCRESHYWWRYNIYLENLSDLAVRLKERHWRIFTGAGALESAQGHGVGGLEVILSRREPVFQYCSHVSMDEPSGHMWGSFRMEREDGLAFECAVPSFTLESRGGGMFPPESIIE